MEPQLLRTRERWCSTHGAHNSVHAIACSHPRLYDPAHAAPTIHLFAPTNVHAGGMRLYIHRTQGKSPLIVGGNVCCWCREKGFGIVCAARTCIRREQVWEADDEEEDGEGKLVTTGRFIVVHSGNDHMGGRHVACAVVCLQFSVIFFRTSVSVFSATVPVNSERPSGTWLCTGPDWLWKLRCRCVLAYL